MDPNDQMFDPPASTPGGEWPETLGTLISGGTYPRDHALLCAVTLCAPQFNPSYDVEAAILPIADVFAKWLSGA